MKKNIFFIVALFSATVGFAQFDFVTYGSSVAGASNNVNPGMRLPGEITFTFPGLSSIYASATSSISPSDFISQQPAGNYAVDIPLLMTNLNDVNGISGRVDYSPMFISWHTKKRTGFFTMSYNHIVDFKGVLSDDLINYFGQGNAAFVNETVNITDDQFGLLHYQKVHFGYTHFINDKLSIGAKVNGYGGFNHFEISKLNAEFFTDGNSFPAYATTASAEFEAQAGGIIAPELTEGESYEFGGPSHMLGIGKGLGFDLGFEYQATKNISIAAAGRDLGGKIKWNEEFGRKMSINGTGEIDFNGFETSLSAEDPGAEFQQQADDLEEELKSEFDLTTTPEAYSSSIGAGFSLSGQYTSDNKKHTAIALLDGKNSYGDLLYRAGAIYHFSPAKWVQLSAAYSWSEAAPANIGTGVTFNMGSAQLHLSSDNIVTLFNQENLGQAAFRFGFNIQYPLKEKPVAEDVLEGEEITPTETKTTETKKYFE